MKRINSIYLSVSFFWLHYICIHAPFLIITLFLLTTPEKFSSTTVVIYYVDIRCILRTRYINFLRVIKSNENKWWEWNAKQKKFSTSFAI